MGRRRLKGAAALSIVALASAMGAASASAETACTEACPPPQPPLTTPGRANAFLKIQNANGNAVNAFYKFQTGDAFHKIEGLTNAFHKIEANNGQAFYKLSQSDQGFLKYLPAVQRDSNGAFLK